MKRIAVVGTVFCLACLAAVPAAGSSILYSNLGVTGGMAAASRTGANEIESADDFILSAPASIISASFIGLLQDPLAFNDLNLEFYRVFPNDSTNPPNGTVPTRVNSPSDVAFAERDLATGITSVTLTVLNQSFTAANSILNGINPSPNQTTGGEGSVTGKEVLFTVLFSSPVVLPPDHYFFVPQVGLTSGDFFWLSAIRPTPFGTSPDLQAWIRNSNIDPNWLRDGTDIVGGTPAPTFNMAFELQGDTVPEPTTMALVGSGVILLARRRRRVSSQR